MTWIEVPAGSYALGWRHDATLSPEAHAGLDAFLPAEEIAKAFSPAREVLIEAFAIEAQPVPIGELLNLDDLDLPDLEAVCDHLDQILAATGRRLPTEDEFEAALGPALFAWGDTLPDDIPYEARHFSAHREPAANGMVLPHDTYQVELVRTAFKMGDGGSAVCGDYPWPVAWLTLSPCAHVPKELVDDMDVWLEFAVVHPVRVP